MIQTGPMTGGFARTLLVFPGKGVLSSLFFLFSLGLLSWKDHNWGAARNHLGHHMGKACLRARPTEGKAEMGNEEGAQAYRHCSAPGSSHA